MPGLKLMAELGLDGSGFEAGFKKAEGMAHGVAHGLKDLVVAGVGIYTVEQAIHKTVETAEELVNASKRLSIAPEQLQVLRQAAKEAGTDLGTLETAFEKIDIAREKALSGGKEGRDAKRAFGALGIGMEDLQSKTAAQLFAGPLATQAKNRNPEELGIALKEIMGKAFGQVIPVLKTDFVELEGKMKSMGAIMDSDTAVKLKMAGEELGFIAQLIASHVGPALVKFAEGLYGLALRLGKTLAGGAAAVGAGTAKWGVKDWANAAIQLSPAMVGFQAGKNKGDLDATGKALSGATGFDTAAASQAKDEAEKPWTALQNQFKDMLAEMAKRADELKHPKAPDFTKPTLGEQLSKKALETPSDSMTKVGNFLGGMGLASGMDQKKVSLLQQIASNTKGRRASDGHSTERDVHYPHC